MKKNTKLFLVSALFITLLGIVTPITTPVFAGSSNNPICNQPDLNDAAKKSLNCDNSAGTLQSSITGIINAIIAVSGIIAVIFVIIGGINYMTSAGDPSKLKKAKDTILYACIGIAVCALAFAIVNWVISILP